jgi:hypothetical protein
MTEYEAAQLALSESMRIQGLLGIVQTQGELIANDVTQYTSMVFGYLLVAYFIGANLTRVQVSILTLFYVVSIFLNLFNSTGNGLVAISLNANLLALLPEGTIASPSATVEYLAITVAVGSGVVFTSLYFMWSVRHPKTE